MSVLLRSTDRPKEMNKILRKLLKLAQGKSWMSFGRKICAQNGKNFFHDSENSILGNGLSLFTFFSSFGANFCLLNFFYKPATLIIFCFVELHFFCCTVGQYIKTFVEVIRVIKCSFLMEIMSSYQTDNSVKNLICLRVTRWKCFRLE